MQRFVKVPLIFLFVGSLLGLFLRWQFVSPTTGVNYTYFLHAHSHIMFLAWVFNVLMIAFTCNHILSQEQKTFKRSFIVLQGTVVGMLIAFPLQGYAFYSILFSTLHTLIAIVFIVQFFRKTQYVASISSWYAKAALIFFVISSLGPFSLGYLMSAGMGHSNWYYFSIYFYLHFQYNGFFLFGILSLFFGLLERKHITFDRDKAKLTGILLAIACVPAYLLSTLWAKPGAVYNVIGGVAALLQLVALVPLIQLLIKTAPEIRVKFKQTSFILLVLVTTGFIIKLGLQLISSIPEIARLAYELRPVTIAYLHLVLVGVITLFLLLWYYESDLLHQKVGKIALILFFVSFVGMEACLIATPWWTNVGLGSIEPAKLTFIFSAGIFLSSFVFLLAYFRKTDKNQFSR